MSDAALTGDVVSCNLSFGPTVMEVKMLFGTRGADLYVIADPQVLLFIQRAVHHDLVSEHARPERKTPVRASKAAKTETPEHPPIHDDGYVAPVDEYDEGTGDELSKSSTACGHKDDPK